MTRENLNNDEYGAYYALYIEKVPKELSLNEAYDTCDSLVDFFNGIDSDKLMYRYATDKWTIKEVFQHLIDTERVFAHRMFRIGRQDMTPLPGFDQNVYMAPSGANGKSLESLNAEYLTTRANTVSILRSFTLDQLSTIGKASGLPLSVRAAAFIILGHEIWHMEIIEERYL